MSNGRIAGVRFEGTISPHAKRATFDTGEHPDPAVVKRLAELKAEGWWIIVISSFANQSNLMGEVERWLIATGIDFDEVWGSYGFPELDLYIDNQAEHINESKRSVSRTNRKKVPSAASVEGS